MYVTNETYKYLSDCADLLEEALKAAGVEVTRGNLARTLNVGGGLKVTFDTRGKSYTTARQLVVKWSWGGYPPKRKWTRLPDMKKATNGGISAAKDI